MLAIRSQSGPSDRDDKGHRTKTTGAIKQDIHKHSKIPTGAISKCRHGLSKDPEELLRNIAYVGPVPPGPPGDPVVLVASRAAFP